MNAPQSFDRFDCALAGLFALYLVILISSCGKPNVGALLSGWHCKVRMTTPDVKPRDVVVIDAEIITCVDKHGRTVVMP